MFTAAELARAIETDQEYELLDEASALQELIPGRCIDGPLNYLPRS